MSAKRDYLSVSYAELSAMDSSELEQVAGALLRAMDNVRAGDAIDGGRAYSKRTDEQAARLIQDLSNAQRVVIKLQTERA